MTFSPLKAWFDGQKKTPEKPHRTQLGCVRLEDRTCPAITFDFDYSLDTAGFFDAAKRAAVVEAGQEVGQFLGTHLGAITPAGGGVLERGVLEPDHKRDRDSPQPDNRGELMKIYLGAQPMTDAAARGGAGSVEYQFGGIEARQRGNAAFGVSGYSQHYAAWGGSVGFSTSELWPASRVKTVMLHELGHVLGFLPDVQFNRDRARFVNGGTQPANTPDGHWVAGTPSWDGSQAIMRNAPVNLQSFTGLDLAGLQDVGWAVAGAVGSNGADTIVLSRLDGTMVRATVNPGSANPLTHDFDGASGIGVWAGDGADSVFIYGPMPGPVTVYGGSGVDYTEILSPGVLMESTNDSGGPTRRFLHAAGRQTDVTFADADNDTFSDMESVAVKYQAPPAVVAYNGVNYAFAVGADSKLWMSQIGPSGVENGHWIVDSAGVYAPGTAVHLLKLDGTSGYMQAYAVDESGAVRLAQFTYQTGQWTAYQLTDSGVFWAGAPLVTREPGGGQVQLFGVDDENVVRQVQYTPGVGWGNYPIPESAGRFDISAALTLHVNPGGALQLYGVATDGTVWLVQHSGGWGAYPIVETAGKFVRGTPLTLSPIGTWDMQLYGVDAESKVRYVQYVDTDWVSEVLPVAVGVFIAGTPLTLDPVNGPAVRLYGADMGGGLSEVSHTPAEGWQTTQRIASGFHRGTQLAGFYNDGTFTLIGAGDDGRLKFTTRLTSLAWTPLSNVRDDMFFNEN